MGLPGRLPGDTPMQVRSLINRCLISGICLASFALPLSYTRAAQLSFEERVEAQRAIERVYYRHQEKATLPFEQVVTTELLERKVRAQLQESLLLETRWHHPVTTAA